MTTRPGQRYSADEDQFIRLHYPKRGHKWVAEKLGRSPGSVWSRAKRLGIQFGEIDGWTRVTTLAQATGQLHNAVWLRAKREGVLRRVGAPKAKRGKARAAVVPNSWADSYLAEHQALRHGEHLLEHAGWLTLEDAAKVLRVAKSTVNRAAHGKGLLAPLLEDVRKARAASGNRKGQWLLEPYGVNAVARELDRQRALARGWVSTKSLAIEHGVEQHYAATIGKREFGGELLFVHGRQMCFVSPEAARLMRRRFSEGVTPGRRRGRPRKHPELRRAA